MSKTEDVTRDFRCEPSAPQVATSLGQAVEVPGQPGNNKQNSICKKGRRRLFCLHKMAKFNVDGTMMTMMVTTALSKKF